MVESGSSLDPVINWALLPCMLHRPSCGQDMLKGGRHSSGKKVPGSGFDSHRGATGPNIELLNYWIFNFEDSWFHKQKRKKRKSARSLLHTHFILKNGYTGWWRRVCGSFFSFLCRAPRKVRIENSIFNNSIFASILNQPWWRGSKYWIIEYWIFNFEDSWLFEQKRKKRKVLCHLSPLLTPYPFHFKNGYTGCSGRCLHSTPWNRWNQCQVERGEQSFFSFFLFWSKDLSNIENSIFNNSIFDK
jgi:hypothetical protein